MKLNKCYNFDDFQSYQAYPHHTDKSPLKDRNCHIMVFSDKACKGESLNGADLRHGAGVCDSAVFNKDPKMANPLVRQSKSAKFVCQKDPAPPKPSKGVSVSTKPITIVVHSTVSPSMPATTVVSTVTATPSSSSSKPTQVRIATVKSTATMMVKPVTTVKDTTTVWVAPSSHRISTLTETVTWDKANKGSKARVTGAERRAVEASAAVEEEDSADMEDCSEE